ncbi:MAG: TIGR04255 family protein [Candidatus Sulfotelmatobacter sp.]|jgi:uncharacterized protein (TIGR04255 family)
MPVKRSNPPLHLSRTPLIYVVSQVRFSAIVAMEKFIPEIQEKLRHKYPWFQRSKIQELMFQAQGAPSVSFNDRYEFLQRDKRTGVVLMSNSVALHTNKYTSYEAFEQEFTNALGAIHESAGIGLVERIGLRYVDLVRLAPNEAWSDYIKPGLLGLDAASVGVSEWTSQSVRVGRTEVGTLAFRYTQSESPVPPDLTPVTLQYEGELLRPKEVGTILDFDHYSEVTREFELEAVIGAIGDLHDNVDRAFRSAVTPTALRKWE